jgi:hypothetical protein
MAGGETTGKKAGNIAVKQEKLLEKCAKIMQLECVLSSHKGILFSKTTYLNWSPCPDGSTTILPGGDSCSRGWFFSLPAREPTSLLSAVWQQKELTL